MNMIEKVARAIAQAREQNGGPPFDAYDRKYARSALFDEAKAAIEAMREPTESMIKSAWADALAEDAKGVWITMIDDALKQDT